MLNDVWIWMVWHFADARFLKEHGIDCYREKRYEEAIDFYTRSIQFTENVQVYMLRGKTYNKLHRSHEANKDFLKAIEVDSYFYKVYRSKVYKVRPVYLFGS